MKKNGFTLIELMVGILIFSIVIIGGFKALSAVGIGKIRLIEKTNIDKEAFYFSEKLFEMIKKGGTIDYEEYWNRNIINKVSLSYLSGHYGTQTGFGNFGGGGNIGSDTYGGNFYYCRSTSNKMGTGGCSTGNLAYHTGAIADSFQRYGQYSFQFIDYNSNSDADLGDENGDGKIIGDDDDDYLGEGPEVFPSGNEATELYLISGNKKKRTLFRWNVIDDPDRPNTVAGCNFRNQQNPTGSGCLGTIQFLELDGKDWGLDHDTDIIPSSSLYDGIIDTWLISDKLTASDTVAGSDANNYWVDLFPKSINVSDFKVFLYPNKDIELAWKDDTAEVNIAPYVRISMNLSSSWKTKRKVPGKPTTLRIATTIALTDLYSK